jgi:hypothetical protein
VAIEVPSDPQKLQQLKAMIVEMTYAMQRIDQEREALKDIAKETSEQFGLQKKVVNKLARTMYKHDFATLQQENEEFEQLYESVTGVKSKPEAA